MHAFLHNAAHGSFAGSHDYWLVLLSTVIAVISAYAALDLGGRVTASRGRARSVWLAGGALAMGSGIWAMHYIGMLAYSLPVRVLYNLPLVLLSLFAAVLASAVALFAVSRQSMGHGTAAFGGLLMGSGIAAMHYIGMSAMRLPAEIHYELWIVALSVALAVAIAFVALWLTFAMRAETNALGMRKLGTALLMGAAIPIMHYTGMAAVSFTPLDTGAAVDARYAVEISFLGTAGIGGVTLLILALTIVTAIADRRFSAQALEIERSEQRYRELVESAKVILWRADLCSSRFSYVNREAEAVLGYRQQDWLETPGFWLDRIHPEDRAAAQAHCRASMETGVAQRFEHRMIRAGGEVVWLRTSITATGEGPPGELLGVMTDITERKRAQEAAEAAAAEIERLNVQLKRENVRMSAELDVSKRLQQMILPRDEELRHFPNLDIAGFMQAADEVGGDYHDVIAKDDSVLFCMGDVTGHGLESGVIAIMAQTAVRTLVAAGMHQDKRFFEILNQVIYDNVRHMGCDRNLTFSLLHYRDRQVTISGQHEEVLVVRGNGSLERHDTLELGFPIGLEKDVSQFFGETKIPLGSGDVMVMYTDGITEAVNMAGITYGVERLATAIAASSTQPASGIREAVLASLTEYVGGRRLYDDISLLVVKPA